MVTDDQFPEFFVCQPPDRNTLQTIYFKVLSENGPVFWRHKGDDTGRETSMYDVLMEEKNGFGIQGVGKEETPWADRNP